LLVNWPKRGTIARTLLRRKGNGLNKEKVFATSLNLAHYHCQVSFWRNYTVLWWITWLIYYSTKRFSLI